jgi:hypothetical protein
VPEDERPRNRVGSDGSGNPPDETENLRPRIAYFEMIPTSRSDLNEPVGPDGRSGMRHLRGWYGACSDDPRERRCEQ